MKIDLNRLFCIKGEWFSWGQMTKSQRQEKKESKIKMFEASKKPWYGEDEETWKTVEVE